MPEDIEEVKDSLEVQEEESPNLIKPQIQKLTIIT
jgi:hypothetical protein